jgi:protein ImuB
MRIPSYDELTPPIPDISSLEVRAAVGRVLHGGAAVVVPAAGTGSPARQLYAALHGGPTAVARLAGVAAEFSPRIERHPGGTVVLDVAGLQRLLGDAAAIADELARAGEAHVAMARSYTAALLLARARTGTTVSLGEPGAALAGVPLRVLQQYLADGDRAAAGGRRSAAAAHERTGEVLRRWGLLTIGELAALPAADLSARLGPEGVAVQRLARGLDPRPLVPDPSVPRFTGSFELEWPIDTLEPLSFVFARLLDPLIAALERADRGAVALHLQLRLTNRTAHERTLQLPVAMRDPRVLRTLLLLDLESHPPPAAVDVVALEIDPAPARIVQYSLLERAVPSPETLATLMARLGALVGEGRCGSPALRDTHQPDGFSMAPVAFAEARTRALRSSPSGADDADGLPDGGAGAGVLRRFRPPVALRVAVERGRPARVAVDRRGMPGGVVQDAAGPWRTSGGWWDGSRWNRDEWDVALADGTVCRLFHDRDSGVWFLDGVFD